MARYFLPVAVLVLLAAATLRFSQLHSYPPGPHYDEAANVRITRSVAFGGADLFPIADSYQGRESLYFYLSAPLFQAVDDSAYVLRVVSTFANLLTIAGAMALGRMAFPGRRGYLVGLAAGVLMTVSFHQVLMSRQAFRAVTLPMTQALALAFLWRGLRVRRGWPWLLVGGVMAGGALYTYMASRLFPVWLAIGGVALLWFDRANWRLRLRQGVIFFGALGLAALPMMLYALERPDVFFQRLTEVSDGQNVVSLGESIRRHLEMFFIRGDFGNLRYNIPGRPYFTNWQAVFLLIGLSVSAWRVFRAKMPLERAAYLLALLSPLMVIPSVIAVGGYPPSHMRSLGMVPLIFIVVAVGMEMAYSFASHRVYLLQRAVVPGVLLVGVLAVGSVSVASAYFGWASRADLFAQADGDLGAAADWLTDEVTPGTPVYVGAYYRQHPTVITGYDGDVTWLGSDSLILPPSGQSGVLVFARNAEPPADWREMVAPYRVENVPSGPDGEPAFWAYRLPPDAFAARFAEAEPLASNPYLSLLDAETTPSPAGQTTTVTLTWRVNAPVPYSQLRPVISLRNQVGGTLVSNAPYLLETDRWRVGEVIMQQVQLDVPPATPPQTYPLMVRWIDYATDSHVSYVDASGGSAGLETRVGTLQVTRPDGFPSPDDLAIPIRRDVDVRDGVRLLGWDVLPERARPGEMLDVTLYWQAVPAESTRGELALSGRLQGDNAAQVWQGTLDYPPGQWQDGELVRTHLQWPVPTEQPAGDYRVVLQAVGQAIDMGMLVVEGVPRRFDAPSVAQESDVTFGGQIALYGYTLNREPDSLTLELVWQALRRPEADYTVFVHVIDADGNILTQRDRMPQQGDYPTGLWTADEFVVDRYQFDDLPDGASQVAVGLYRQASGIRLVMFGFRDETFHNAFIISLDS